MEFWHKKPFSIRFVHKSRKWSNFEPTFDYIMLRNLRTVRPIFPKIAPKVAQDFKEKSHESLRRGKKNTAKLSRKTSRGGGRPAPPVLLGLKSCNLCQIWIHGVGVSLYITDLWQASEKRKKEPKGGVRTPVTPPFTHLAAPNVRAKAKRSIRMIHWTEILEDIEYIWSFFFFFFFFFFRIFTHVPWINLVN